MVEHIIKFTLPEEQNELETHMQAANMGIVLFELAQWMRQICKYNYDNHPQEVLDAYEKVRDKFYELINEYKIELH